MKSILIVDDDEVMRKLIREVLEKSGYSAFIAASGEDAIRFFKKKPTPVVVSDIRMLETDGLTLLKEIKQVEPNTVVILMTAFGSMEGAIEAVQSGAFDYISKPFQMNDLKNLVARAFKHHEALTSSISDAAAKGARSVPTQKGMLVGQSPKIVEVYKQLARAAISSSNVLIQGERGTGKKLVARLIHENSDRKKKPFQSFEAQALEDNAFSGEWVKELIGGSLFIEQVGDLSSVQQSHLVTAIDDGLFDSVRLMTGDSTGLEKRVREQKFREDLFFKLNVITIDLPALRERMEDLAALVEHFLAKHAAKNQKAVSHVSDEAMAKLKAYSWPGNVRELEYLIERAVVMAKGPEIFADEIEIDLGKREAESAAKESLESLERAHIVKVLQETGFNKSKASEVLGIDRATLYRKAQKYGIDLKGK